MNNKESLIEKIVSILKTIDWESQWETVVEAGALILLMVLIYIFSTMAML